MLLTIIPMVSQAQTLFPNRGGTGTTVIPTEGYVLVGQSNGTYLPVATTTLGFAGGGGGGAVDSVNGQTGVVILDADDIAEGTNIFFTTERAQDVTGGMVTGNTETRITVTYQDGDGTIDFVVDNDLGNYDSTNLIIEAVNFEATNTAAEDDIATYDAGTGGFTFESPTELCVRITGSSELCDGDDGGGGSSLPDQTGNNGKFLSTDGTDASWETVSAGSVDVVSNVATDRILGRTTAGSGDSEQLTASEVRTLINVEDGATADQDLSGLLPKAGGTMTGNIALNGNYLSGDGGNEGVFVESSGNVGIGTSNPQQALDVNGNIRLDDGITFTGGGSGNNVIIPNDSYLRFGASGASDTHVLVVGDGFGSGGRVNFRYGLAGLRFDSVDGSNRTERAILTNDGDFGIGTASPSEKLDVNGTVNATAFSIGGTAITATAAELNYVDGVTSAIQTQIDAKSPLASPTFTGTLETAALNVTGTATSSVFDGNVTIAGNLQVDGGVSGAGATALIAAAVAAALAAAAAATLTFTNKRIKVRISSSASGDITPTKVNFDRYIRTAQAAAITISNPTMDIGEVMAVQLTDNGTARDITFGTHYMALDGLALPTTTTASKVMAMVLEKVTATKVLVSYVEEA